MTEKELIKKTKLLLKEDNKFILKKISYLFNSGAFNSRDYQNNFALSQIMLHVIYEVLSQQRRPLSIIFKNEANNLKNFI